MVTKTLRVRFLSFEDAETHSTLNVVLYIKKLVQVRRLDASKIMMEEKNPHSPVLLSFDETINLRVDDQFCQVLFIPVETKEALADHLLIRNELLGQYLNDPRYKENVPLELIRTVMVAGKYTLKFTFRFRGSAFSGNRLFRDHDLRSTQFKQPVSCAICDKFIWGLFRQAYQCSRCKFVTHSKCYRKIFFDCLRAPPLLKPRPFPTSVQDRPLVAHQFIISGEKSYCNHCGSLVLQQALKCSQCPCVIHPRCQTNVPPMCIGPPKLEDRPSSEPTVDVPPPPPPPPSPLSLSRSPQFADFKCFGSLGTGRYGIVFCVQHRPSDKYLAIKVVDGSSEEARRQFALEKQILLQYHHDHPYIIKGYCSFHCGSNLFLGMEFVDGDRLNDKIRITRMNEEEVRFYLVELISVIQYLHRKRIIYRDLKLENIMIKSDGHIRLVDYGLGRILAHPDERCRTICGTPAYLAPEIRKLDESATNDGYSYSVDYWTLGMVFGQMLTGGPDQFDVQLSLNNHGQFDPQPIANVVTRLPSDISTPARACLSGLLELDPDKRLGMPHSPYGQIREHRFFTGQSPVQWDEIDEGASKPLRNRLSITSNISTITMPFPNLSFDRSACAINDWMEAGRARFPADEDEQWKCFDFVNDSAWAELK